MGRAAPPSDPHSASVVASPVQLGAFLRGAKEGRSTQQLALQQLKSLGHEITTLWNAVLLAEAGWDTWTDTREKMQHLLYTCLIALSNNVDNLGARVAYSIQGIKISATVNLWISVITFLFSFTSAFFGAAVVGVLGAHVSSVIAMVLLVTIGCLMVLQAFKKRRIDHRPHRQRGKSIWDVLLKLEHADLDDSKHIDFGEATILGIALSINNVGGGLSAGMIGLNALAVGLLSAVLSFVALWAGNHVAEFFIRRHIDKKAAVAGGLILIAIGIGQVV